MSAQSRKRLYRTNIPNVTLPEDKKIILKDVLQNNVDPKYMLDQKQIEKMKYLKGPKEIMRGGGRL